MEEKNYDYIYDKEAGKFKITFHIKEDAKGDQTVELSKVMEEINAAGKKQFDEWFKTEEGAKELDDAHSIMVQRFASHSTALNTFIIR